MSVKEDDPSTDYFLLHNPEKDYRVCGYLPVLDEGNQKFLSILSKVEKETLEL